MTQAEVRSRDRSAVRRAVAGGLTLVPAREGGRSVVRITTDGSEPLPHLDGATLGADRRVLVAGRSAAVLAALREIVPWLRPVPLGTRRSIGMGDRLGIATTGHVAALRRAGAGVGAVLAQQSVREMARTRRSPREVLDDATWGVLEAGWTEGYGADADHLRRLEDVDACVRAGYTMFTIDPGDVLVPAAAADPSSDTLPWTELEDTWRDMRRRWVAAGAAESDVAATVARYLPALAHVVRANRLIAGRTREAYDLEVCVDESGTRTTELAHRWFTTELRRLGVPLTGFAPCFVGVFEKGVDYSGDLAALRRDVAAHAAVARGGPHKLSVHSGSDKFSMYPLLAEEAADVLHLKTSGTSWLTALRTAGTHEPALLREVFSFASRNFEAEVSSYHVSAGSAPWPDPYALPDAQVLRLLDAPATRQALHVAYGAVLAADDGARFRAPLLAVLADHAGEHEQALAEHLARHLVAFGAVA